MILFTDTFFHVLWLINLVIVTIFGVLYFNQAFHMVLSIFVPAKKYEDTKEEKTYGFLIAARNEKDSIANIIDSIKAQNYNQERIHIFVVADNCSDETAEIARSKGAFVFERNDKEKLGKSYALEFAFKEIFEKYEYLNIDAFFIFDADNLLDENYVAEMNKAFNSKNDGIITSLRLPKNFSDSWLAGGSSYMFLRECRQIHHDRSTLDIGTYVSGTGYLISKEVIKELNYWPFHTLVEDVEISAYMASRGVKIRYCETAKFYDEQPTNIKAYWIQRLRWCKGNHQVFFKEGGSLFKGLFKKQPLTSWGMFVHTMPLPALCFIWFILYFIIGLAYFLITKVPFDIYLHECLRFTSENLLYPIPMGLLLGLVVMIESWKLIDAKWYKKILYAFTFPIAMYLFLPITVIALFVKVKWKPTHQIK